MLIMGYLCDDIIDCNYQNAIPTLIEINVLATFKSHFHKPVKELLTQYTVMSSGFIGSFCNFYLYKSGILVFSVGLRDPL